MILNNQLLLGFIEVSVELDTVVCTVVPSEHLSILMIGKM